jgi:hypothetical protein
MLRLRLLRHSVLRHDFQVLVIRCERKLLCERATVLWIDFGSHLSLRLNKLKRYQLLSKVIVVLHHRLQKITGRILYAHLYTLFGTSGSKTIHSASVPHKTPRRRLGGGCVSKAYSFSQISDHLVPGSTEAGQDNMFRYVAHVDEIELLTYPSPQFVHTTVPLNELFTFLPLPHARKIATIHGISVGSRCSTTQLKMLIENHSCIRCHTFFTVFSIELTPGKLTARCVAKFKAKKSPQKPL